MGRQHVFSAKDRYAEHSLPPYASISGRHGWLAWRTGQWLYSPAMAITYSSHFSQLHNPQCNFLRPQHRMPSDADLICSFGDPTGCARKPCWYRRSRCMFPMSASAVPRLPGPKAWQATRQGRPILPRFQEAQVTGKTASASIAHPLQHVNGSPTLLISWRIHGSIKAM